MKKRVGIVGTVHLKSVPLTLLPGNHGDCHGPRGPCSSHATYDDMDHMNIQLTREFLG